jgi:hypothetical protein
MQRSFILEWRGSPSYGVNRVTLYFTISLSVCQLSLRLLLSNELPPVLNSVYQCCFVGLACIVYS